MKLRYTTLQFDARPDALAHPEVDRPHDGVPVAGCSVRSQVATVAAAFPYAPPTARLVYVMTDGASLTISLPRSARATRRNWVSASAGRSSNAWWMRVRGFRQGKC
mgnify:CR=1 FL=1